MTSLEEKRLRSENVGIDIIFDDEDVGSVTSMKMLKDEVTFRVKKLIKAIMFWIIWVQELSLALHVLLTIK